MNSGEPRNTKMKRSAGLRSQGLAAFLATASAVARKKPKNSASDAEIEVPDQPRADQHDLLAEVEIGPRQQPLAIADERKA